MKTIIVDGKEIKTNLNETHGFITGNESWHFYRPEWVLDDGAIYRRMESEQEMFDRLVKAGFTKITFYLSRCRIKGYYELVAHCRY